MLAQLACFTFFKHREHLGMPLPEKHKVNVFHLTELAKGFLNTGSLSRLTGNLDGIKPSLTKLVSLFFCYSKPIPAMNQSNRKKILVNNCFIV